MDSVIKEGSLGFILLRSQIISEEDITKALEEQKVSGCRFGEALVSLGVVTQEDIDWALSNQLNIPYVRLKKELIDRSAVELVSAELARQFNLVPLIRAGDELSVAMADPLNKAAIEAVEHATGCRLIVSIALIREIREMLEFLYGPAGKEETFGFSSDCYPAKVMKSINADVSGARFLDYLLLYIVRNNLSALSLQPLGDTIRVTGRRSGFSREIGRLGVKYYPDLLLRIRKLSRINGSPDISARGVLGFRYRERNIMFQVLLLRGLGGDYVTLKLHVSTTFPVRVADLGLQPEKGDCFRALASAKNGLVLFSMRDSGDRCRLMDLYLEECDTSGKTVLLLGEGLGRGRKRFSRIPIHGVTRGEPQDLVMAALEHEPDIIAIEDVTDSQSFIAANKAAMRGKLVVAGISSYDTVHAFKHLLYFRHKHCFIPATINGMVACKGVLTLCPHCKQSYIPTPEERAVLPPLTSAAGYFKAAGCPACDQTGYQGKRYLMDIIPFDKGMLEAFESAYESKEVLRYLSDKGYRGIAEEGTDLLHAGEISPGEYISAIIL
ncbi:MAG: proteinral secretion pathway protein [Geobacteraceae bacterium]|nr:MAG: proteinral secretion pathway protein [Geobacteraceae bacterium]